jgi:hypothetical protein
MHASTGAKTRKQQKVETNSLGLTNPNFCSRFVSRETSGAKALIDKAFRVPDALAPPGGSRCNRKIADAKTHVFRSLFHTKTPNNTRIPSILREHLQPKIEISQCESLQAIPIKCQSFRFGRRAHFPSPLAGEGGAKRRMRGSSLAVSLMTTLID